MFTVMLFEQQRQISLSLHTNLSDFIALMFKKHLYRGFFDGRFGGFFEFPFKQLLYGF